METLPVFPLQSHVFGNFVYRQAVVSQNPVLGANLPLVRYSDLTARSKN